ncbi:Uncharacterised protein [Chlamydia trachomatis]|nr:Uncharacterised protein [Chlamydia trachomatis]CRH48058.1 Uncharacterised protein [Chlamydia trachomatis]
MRSLSLLLCVSLIYCATTAFCSSEVRRSTKGCSGAKAKKETPIKVSGLVVKTSITPCSVAKLTEAPEDFPIQFFCNCLTLSGQSSSSSPSRS